ncbi:RNase adapter RapZ [Oxalobacter vibrioformis]|uniref:RNase adapter RapZ n=1 Tax=Oxalobacter vibrioformis TaxID=933080 RepID=A0A9E9P2L4_9BURK|nr:RNase adapter RapZ [Oxalobacter vibrioformis]NLC23390.1 RNase adapter RapZ [Oxalobacter sp.]WAW09133.1 RNase adapter RapZ [Oxalobacter vibrioformis]
MHIILITGISGSGKSVALNVLEDAGYFCVDNLPPVLLPNLVETCIEEKKSRLAVAVDSRSAHSLSDLPATVEKLRSDGHHLQVVFLTADTHSLINRFSETRRSHPLAHRAPSSHDPSDQRTLMEAIHAEREMLAEIQSIAHVVDTSHLSTNKLRGWIKEFVEAEHSTDLTLHLESFGFKFGIPQDADLMFDVRSLPNPHYDLRLRPLTGKDEPVRQFLEAQPEVGDLLTDIRQFVEKWLPSYKRDHRSYLTVALGCTGGQHRSVYMIEELARYFSQSETVLVRHRNLS